MESSTEQSSVYDIAVQRDLQLFGRMLDTAPSRKRSVSAHQLFEVIIGCDSDKWVLSHLTTQRKNFVNARRGRHEPTQTTYRLIESELGRLGAIVKPTVLEDPNGPLAPEITSLIEVLIAVPLESGAMPLLERGLLCPCCGATAISAAEVWWDRAVPGIDPGASRAADAVLRVLCAGTEWVSSFVEGEGGALSGIESNTMHGGDTLVELVYPARPAQGRWLDFIQADLGCRNLRELEVTLARLSVYTERGSVISHGLLKKWACAQHLIPVGTGKGIAAASNHPQALTAKFFVARAATLACDLIYAASGFGSPLSLIEVRKLVLERLNYLRSAVKLRPPLGPV